MNAANACPLCKHPATAEFCKGNKCSLVKCSECGEFVISDGAVHKLALQVNERKHLSEVSYKLPDTHILYIFMDGDKVDSRAIDGDNWRELK